MDLFLFHYWYIMIEAYKTLNDIDVHSRSDHGYCYHDHREGYEEKWYETDKLIPFLAIDPPPSSGRLLTDLSQRCRQELAGEQEAIPSHRRSNLVCETA